MSEEVEGVGDIPDAEEVEPGESGAALLVRESTHVEMHTSHQGPLPAPEDFARYEDVLPGAAERILALVESDVEHQHRMDDRNLGMTGRLADRVLVTVVILGLAVIAAAFVIALVLVIQGEAAWGAGIAVVDLVAATIGLVRMMRREPRPLSRDGDTVDADG